MRFRTLEEVCKIRNIRLHVPEVDEAFEGEGCVDFYHERWIYESIEREQYDQRQPRGIVHYLRGLKSIELLYVVDK